MGHHHAQVRTSFYTGNISLFSTLLVFIPWFHIICTCVVSVFIGGFSEFSGGKDAGKACGTKSQRAV